MKQIASMRDSGEYIKLDHVESQGHDRKSRLGCGLRLLAKLIAHELMYRRSISTGGKHSPTKGDNPYAGRVSQQENSTNSVT